MHSLISIPRKLPFCPFRLFARIFSFDTHRCYK